MTRRVAFPGNLTVWRMLMWSGVVVLLLLPLLAMQVTREVKWTASDFITMGLLLGGAGLLVEAAVRLIPSPGRRTAVVAGIGAMLVLVWLQLAGQII